jgi:NAD(P)H-flavin reductase
VCKFVVPCSCGFRSRATEVIRPYTPISPEHVTGHFDLLVKEYPTGVMSKHIAGLKVGDKLEMKGPFPKVRAALWVCSHWAG